MCGFIILDRSCRLSQSATSDSRTQPCPRGTLIADQRRACAARPKGKNEKLPGWSLLLTRQLKFFPATGGGWAAVPPSSFIQASFTSHIGSLLLSSLKKVTFSPSPRFPRIPSPAYALCCFSMPSLSAISAMNSPLVGLSSGMATRQPNARFSDSTRPRLQATSMAWRMARSTLLGLVA